MEQSEKDFIKGYVTCLVNIMNYSVGFDVNKEHREAWQSAGLSLKRMKAAGCDSFDIDKLRPHLKYLNKK